MEEHQPEVSHSQILVAIASIRERLDSVQNIISRQAQEIDHACERLREAEKRLAQVMAIAVVLSILMPILVNVANVKVQVGDTNTSQISR